MFPFSFIGSGVDAQALASYNSLIAAGYTVPQGLAGINSAFRTIKTIYGTSDITNAVSFFADPSLAYQSGAGSGTTLGQAIRTLPNLVDNTRATDAVQTTAASQPLLLTHEGANYFWISGDLASNCTTPNAVANQITGDIEITYRGSFDNNPSTNNLYLSKWEGSGLSYFFGTNNAGNLRVGFNIGGTSTFANSSVAYATGVNWYRVSRVASTGVVTFFQSTENTSNINSVNWVQLGTTQSTISGNITSTNSIVSIYRSADQANRGKVFRATISNSIGGAPVVDFNPSQYNASVSQTQWTSSTGEIWSINTDTAATGYKGVLVNRTILQGDGVDDRMSTSLASYQYITRYASALQYTMASGARMLAGTGSGHLLYNFVNPNIRAFNGVDLDFNNETINRLQLFTANYNSLTSTGLLNNANTASGDTGTNSSTVLSILSNSSSAQFANAGITTILQARQVDNTAQNTAMYNYIRSINNNAF